MNVGALNFNFGTGTITTICQIDQGGDKSMRKTARVYNSVEAIDEIVQLQDAILVPCSPSVFAASWVYMVTRRR